MIFATPEEWAFPFRFPGHPPTWRAVQLGMPHLPWMIAEFELEAQEEEQVRSILITSLEMLEDCMKDKVVKRLQGVQVVLPPSRAPSGDWTLVKIVRVEKELRSFDGAHPSIVLSDASGQRWGGLPMEPTTRSDTDLVVIADI